MAELSKKPISAPVFRNFQNLVRIRYSMTNKSKSILHSTDRHLDGSI